jgi:branched-chain amino acid transport system substrate-binding protein
MGKWKRAGTTLVGLALVAGLFAACGGSSTGTAGGSGCSGKTLKLVTELAVSGTDAGAQLPAQYGVDLAVQQNSDLGGGCKLAVQHDNYEGTNGVDPAIGANNATQDVADPSVMVIVGTFNSGVAKVVIPIIEQAGVTMISPANTNPGLTLQQYAADNGINFSQLHPAGIPEYYFRVVGNDVVQGQVDAQLSAKAPISAKTAYVTDDDTTYGKGLSKYFTNTFTGGGGTVVGTASITPQQISSLPSLAATIKSKNPDIVFFGGVTSGGGGTLKKDLVTAGYNGPMVGGDGIADDPAWLTAAGSAAPTTCGSVAAPDISTFTQGAAAKFESDYKAAFPGKDLTPYSATSYDSAMVEITAMKSIISQGKQLTRAAIRDAVAAISYSGVIGTITFDANGDISGNKVFSIYCITPTTGGQWAFQEQVNG